MRPAGQQRGERRRTGEVRVGVEGDVDPGGERIVDEREQLGRASPVRGEVHGRVGEVHGAAGAASDADALGERGERAPPVPAGVGCPVTPVGGDDGAERLELRGVGVHAGGVGEPARHADGAGGERVGEDAAHAVELGCGGGPVGGAHREQAQVALRHQVRHVRAQRRRVERREIAGGVAPGERLVGEVAVPAGDLPPHQSQRGVVDRGVADAVLPEHLRGHTLAELRELGGVVEHGEVRVGVHVDEAGREGEPRWSSSRGAEYRDHALADHLDIGCVARSTRAVDDGHTLEQH